MGVAAACVVMLVPGCSSQNRNNLVVYSPHGKEMLTAFEQEYEKLHPDVDVQWLDMGSQDAYDRIRTERENPQADIWWGAPSTTFAKAEKDSLLEKYVPSWAGAVKPEMKSAHGYWYGTFLTPEVIMYNNHVLNESTAPHDWDDLLDVQWKDKIIIRYPIASGTMRIIFSAIIEREARRTGTTNAGFDWLLRLDANTKDYAADPTQMYLKIAREEGLVSLWDLPDVMLQTRVNGYPFGYVLPTSGTPLIVDCIAIVKGTRHLAEAERFYEFVTSREALTRQAREFVRIPARNDIPTSDLPEWIAGLNLKAMDVDWEVLEENEKQWMKRWDDDIKGKGSSISSAAH